MRKSAVLGFLLVFALAPVALQGQSDLLGDKDCFGTLDACVEGTEPFGWFDVVQGPGDPAFTDDYTISNTDGTTSWTHTVGVGSYSAATLVFRTAGIADISGPYDVFVDGVSVGQMPFDGGGHILIETFTFAVDPLALADGLVTVSFTSESPDTWAIDYSELFYTAAVPEPASILLMASGFLGLVGVRIRRRS